MKKFIAAIVAVSALGIAPAFAADMEPARTYTKAAPVAYSPAYNWTGFYVGLNGGYEFSGARTSDTFRNAASVVLAAPEEKGRLKGWVGGGQIGYNWQMANWVVGLETDIQATGAKQNIAFACAACGPGGALFSQKSDWFGTLRARAGILVTPGLLFYGTGGWAYGNVKTAFTLFNTTNTAVFTNNVTKGGFAVGGGIEGMINNNWTARVEYLYVDLGTVETGGQVAGVAVHHDTFTTRFYENIVRGAINYKF